MMRLGTVVLNVAATIVFGGAEGLVLPLPPADAHDGRHDRAGQSEVMPGVEQIPWPVDRRGNAVAVGLGSRDWDSAAAHTLIGSLLK